MVVEVESEGKGGREEDEKMRACMLSDSPCFPVTAALDGYVFLSVYILYDICRPCHTRCVLRVTLLAC